jgi:hypothetical protein
MATSGRETNGTHAQGGDAAPWPRRVAARWRRRLALPLLAVALAACGSSSPTAAPASPLPSALPAGTYTSQSFQPAVTFTLPDGWTKPVDSASYLELRPVGSDVTGIFLFRDAQAMSQDPGCPDTPEPGVGATSSELAAWIRERPGLLVSEPRLASVGGLSGTGLDLGIASGWSESCPFANGIPTVPLIVSPEAGYRWVIAGGERLRLFILDVPGGGTVIVDIDDFEGTSIDALIAQATPIVNSFVFARE